MEVAAAVVQGTDIPGAGPVLEELVQYCINLKERQEEARWEMAGAFCVVLSTGAKASWLASQVGVGASTVRKYVRAFLAFPKEDMRVPELGFEMHCIAALSPDPTACIARAADEGLSTRQLRKLVAEEKGSVTAIADAEAEEKQEMARAKRALAVVEEVLSRGGPAAQWLLGELEAVVQGRAPGAVHTA